VTPTGIRKAALLLRNLEPSTAGELLRSAPPEVVKQVAAELVYLESTGEAAASAEPAVEFLGLLQGDGQDVQDFVRTLVTRAVGQDQSDEILGQIDQLIDDRDPFLPIRQASAALLADTLKDLHPQAAALVLMELDAEKSAALIPLLDESIRGEAVRRMALGERVSPEARTRVAAMIRDGLEARRASGETPTVATGGNDDIRLRRVAVLLRRLRRELRDALLESIRKRDADQARRVQDLMVTWEDVPLVTDRSLQDILRTMDAGALALATQGADPAVEHKIRSNISERAVAMLDEEISLMRRLKPEDIEASRESILVELRQLNAAGELAFEGTQT